MKKERDCVTVPQLISSDEWIGDIVYFILSPMTKKVKIGRSSNTSFINRLDDLQIACPDQLEVVGITKGGAHEEEHIHMKFFDMHYRGEWYNYTKEIREYVRNYTTSIVIRRNNHTRYR